MTSDTYADNTFWYPVAYVPARRGPRFYFAAGPRFPFLLREPHKGDDDEEEGEPGIGGDDGRVSQSANKSGGVARFPLGRISQSSLAGTTYSRTRFPLERISQSSLAACPASGMFNDRLDRTQSPIEKKEKGNSAER